MLWKNRYKEKKHTRFIVESRKNTLIVIFTCEMHLTVFWSQRPDWRIEALRDKMSANNDRATMLLNHYQE